MANKYSIMLESAKLFLRPISITDREEVFHYRSDRETNKYQSFVPSSIEEVDAFILGNPAEFNLPRTWFQLVIIDKATDTIIGDIGIHFIDQDGFICELGCTLSKKSQGRGLAKLAMGMVIDHLFKTLKKHRIIASVDPDNIASINLLERLGFRKEAHFRESLYMNDQWLDDVVYAILKREWKRD